MFNNDLFIWLKRGKANRQKLKAIKRSKKRNRQRLRDERRQNRRNRKNARIMRRRENLGNLGSLFGTLLGDVGGWLTNNSQQNDPNYLEQLRLQREAEQARQTRMMIFGIVGAMVLMYFINQKNN